MLSINIYYITPNRSSVLATVHQGMSASKALSLGVTNLRPCESLTLHQHLFRQASMNSSTCDGADFDQNTSVRGREDRGILKTGRLTSQSERGIRGKTMLTKKENRLNLGRCNMVVVKDAKE
ncbi:hypothetical protein PoB_005677900 [Plakobranchus ocellatus]|uniref:Uncharacterized protein n=1 Tax=Plakobranchus ocellatus TaxID=259542 RepID=A0AAV4CCF7_9GAST|nr:hypothetical protein PoB_005677900 [Plakobranchus ocellatus]